MKRILSYALILAAGFSCTVPAQAIKLNLNKVAKAVGKGVQAATVTDEQMAAYASESVKWMDTHNPVLPNNSPYVKRLNKLTAGLTHADGIPLNFKVYNVSDVNAFACPDGSVRVFSSLMDIMDDDELLGVIGHEIGHVTCHHSKKAFKQELLTGAAKDAISSAGGIIGALTDSQLGALGQSLAGAKFSQKQENEADDFGYDFLKQNGKNPWGMVAAFEKLQKMEGGNGKTSYVTKMFSSHPETAKRIKHLSERAIKDGIEKPAAKE